MIERFKLLWLLIALAYEVYYQAKKFFKLSGSKERAEIARITSQYAALQEGENRYLKQLLTKYPDHAWVTKYVKAGRGLSVPGVLAFHMREKEGFHSIWTEEANLSDCCLLLSLGIHFTTAIRQSDGTPHAILVRKYSKKRKEFIFSDPLGSYNTRYRLHYNAYNWISDELLETKNILTEAISGH